MASYFPAASTSRKRPLREAEFPAQTLPPARSPEYSLDDSIYVFPNPASAPSSPTQNSDLSAYTDFTPSVVSETVHLPKNRDGRPSSTRSPSPLTPLSPRRWAEHVTLEMEQICYGDVERPDRWRVGRQRRAVSVSACSVYSDPARTDAPRPHSQRRAPAHIPLLPFFTSLLATDESTICLLSQSPSEPPSLAPPGLRSDCCLEKSDGEPHGLEKLLVRRSGSRTIRDALRYERDLGPRRALPSIPLLGLWNTVTVLVATGGKALREALHR